MRFTITQYRGLDDDTTEDDAKATAWQMLRDKCADAGLAMDGGVRKGDPVPVVVRPDYSGWDPCPYEGAETGHVIEWWCEATDPIRDPDPEPGAYIDGGFVVTIPDDERLLPVHGGPVRVRHNLGGPVTVTATMREGHTGGGILLATPVTDDEEHVELFPGVASLRVVRDEQEE